MLDKYNDILGISELCEALGVGRNSAYILVNSGEIKSFKVGKVHKIPKKCVIDYITQNI